MVSQKKTPWKDSEGVFTASEGSFQVKVAKIAVFPVPSIALVHLARRKDPLVSGKTPLFFLIARWKDPSVSGKTPYCI